MERATETIQLLESSLREQGLETAMDGSIPERPGMRVLIPVRDGKLVRTELHYVPCGELFDALQLYTTIAEDLDEHGMRELCKAAGVWNFSVFLGALAVREDRRALYHRYCLALPGKLTAGECAVMAESILTTILHYIAQFQEDALALAGGMTLEELASAGS